MSLSVVVMTLNAEKHLEKCLENVEEPVLVVDSSSTDGTVALAKRLGAEVKVITNFNHGASREEARKGLKSDIVVFLSQDAYPEKGAIAKLVAPIQEGKAAVSYGRHLPRQTATELEKFTRAFNYPETSQIRRWEEREKWGAYTIFCSNTFAAYRQEALDRVGGFPSTSFGEDTQVTAKLLQQGEAIAYVAEARVEHSHNLTLKETFFRAIAIGKSRSNLLTISSDLNRGRKYFNTLFRHLVTVSPRQIPVAVCQICTQGVGYFIGQIIS
ncbi:MAG: glycosyltransferase family 2 protein [Chlamydiia bacterium]|nr:glycosyltransferase family 2 protein [Chlamydiia bacterium]